MNVLRPDPLPVSRRGALAALAGGLVALAGAAPASALTVSSPALSAVEGAPFSGSVATFAVSFAEIANLACPAPETYAASVAWPDQTPAAAAAGTVGPPVRGVLSCTYPVTAAHTFAEEGAQPVTVTVTPAGGAPVSATATAAVADAALTASGSPASAIAGTPFTGSVASFTDAAPGAGYAAQIAWGDGTAPTDATVAADPAGGFTLSGGHTYDRPGTFATTVTITDPGGSTAQTSGAVTVAPAALPPPPGAGPPAAPPPTPPPAAAGALSSAGPPPLLGLSPPRVAGPSTLALRLSCPKAARCRGVARVITRLARSATLRAGTSLGSTLFVLGPGESRAVAITVSSRLRRALRRLRAARVAGVAIAFGTGGRTAAATGPSAVISTSRLR